MFHEIVSISEMTTADGKRMEEQFLKTSKFKGSIINSSGLISTE
jgi:hypothetical protein